MPLDVINSRGEREPFSFKKVYNSARRAGATNLLAREIAERIEKKVFPGIKTSEIFKEVKKQLLEADSKPGLRFSLKEAMRKLGPTGFPFEKYVAEILQRNGFKTKINQFINGACIKSYEIDFVAQKQGIIYLGECKYHKFRGERVDLKVALQNYARFLDIKKGKDFQGRKLKSILLTNTKFSSNAVKYSRCVGVELLGWRYPRGRGLDYFIESEKLYPVTILPSLRGFLKEIFARKRLMLAEDLLRNNVAELSRKLGVEEKRLHPLIKEAEALLAN